MKSVLQQCYGDPATVTDELVEVILKPGLQPGAVDVFLDFISYSGGPTTEELLEVGEGGVGMQVVSRHMDVWMCASERAHKVTCVLPWHC